MSENPPPFSTMALLFETIERIVERRGSRAVTEQDNLAVREYVGKILLTKRLHLVRTAAQAQELWDEIRAHEAVTDFVLQCTNELDLWLSMSDVPFPQLQELMATAYGHHRPSSDRNARAAVSGIDDDLLDRLPSPEELVELYRGNPWLVTLILINLRGLAIMAYIPVIATPKSGENRS